MRHRGAPDARASRASARRSGGDGAGAIELRLQHGDLGVQHLGAGRPRRRGIARPRRGGPRPRLRSLPARPRWRRAMMSISSRRAWISKVTWRSNSVIRAATARAAAAASACFRRRGGRRPTASMTDSPTRPTSSPTGRRAERCADWAGRSRSRRPRRPAVCPSTRIARSRSRAASSRWSSARRSGRASRSRPRCRCRDSASVLGRQDRPVTADQAAQIGFGDLARRIGLNRRHALARPLRLRREQIVRRDQALVQPRLAGPPRARRGCEAQRPGPARSRAR